jgi:hypothetical protein
VPLKLIPQATLQFCALEPHTASRFLKSFSVRHELHRCRGGIKQGGSLAAASHQAPPRQTRPLKP